MLIGIKIKKFGLLHELSLGVDLQDLKKMSTLSEMRELPTLKPISVFIGQNASGKSTFFEALRFLADAISLNVHIASNQTKHGSYSSLIYNHKPEKYDLEFELLYEKKEGVWLHYYLKISSDKFNRPYFSNEKITKYIWLDTCLEKTLLLEVESKKGKILQNKKSVNSKEYLPVSLTERKISAVNIFGHQEEYQDIAYLYYQITTFFYSDFKQLPKIIDREQKTGGHKHLNAECSNIKNVVFYLKKQKPQEFKALQKRLNQNLRNHNRIDLNRLDKIDNEAQIRYLVLFLILTDDKPLIAFDEPDNGLYYEMADSLGLELRDYTLRNQGQQVFVATHNTNLLDSFSPNEVWSFDRIQKTGETDKVSTRYIGADPVVKAMYKEGIGLGSLWYSGYLDI
ncbi:MAG: ATP-binding protein [Clostridiaceae bacterium]|nr:ATP-binding protein [Clostridiaceae bacterium]